MLENLILKSKNKIAELSQDKLKQLYYGYNCDPNTLQKIEKISEYVRILEHFARTLYLGYKPCLTDNCDEGTLKCIEEHLTKLIGTRHKIKCSTVTIDTTFQQEWDDAHPICRSYEVWEKWSRVIAREYDIVTSLTKVEQNLVVELSRQTIPSELIIALSLIKEEKKGIEVKVSREIKEAAVLKFNTSILYSKSLLELETYLSFIESNLTFDVIKTVYEAGLALEVEKTEKSSTVSLVTSLEKYDIDKLNVNISVLKELSS